MDELQLGLPKEAVSEEKLIELDLSGYDLSNKDEKKEAKARLESAVDRFKKRQRRSLNKCWSGAKINLEKGTALLSYSDVGQICVEVFEEMGVRYNIECPVTGEFDIGRSWKETH